jgi:hypothetical protein
MKSRRKMSLLRFARNDPFFDFLRALENDGLGKNHPKGISAKSSPAKGGAGGLFTKPSRFGTGAYGGISPFNFMRREVRPGFGFSGMKP